MHKISRNALLKQKINRKPVDTMHILNESSQTGNLIKKNLEGESFQLQIYLIKRLDDGFIMKFISHLCLHRLLSIPVAKLNSRLTAREMLFLSHFLIGGGGEGGKIIENFSVNSLEIEVKGMGKSNKVVSGTYMYFLCVVHLFNSSVWNNICYLLNVIVFKRARH